MSKSYIKIRDSFEFRENQQNFEKKEISKFSFLILPKIPFDFPWNKYIFRTFFESQNDENHLNIVKEKRKAFLNQISINYRYSYVPGWYFY